MSKMMRKMWHQGNELALRAQIQLVEAKRRALPTVRARLGKGQGGATMVEYAILVALVSIVAIIIIAVLGKQITDVFKHVSDQLSTAAPVAAPE